MMREILFRGKRSDTGKWVYGCYCRFGWVGQEKGYIIPSYASACTPVDIDSATVGQYTGLMDKAGKRIFEGDICVDRRGFRFIVVWDDDARFLGRGVGAQQEYIRYVGQEPAVEILGNIHDNPELAGGMRASGEEPAP